MSDSTRITTAVIYGEPNVHGNFAEDLNQQIRWFFFPHLKTAGATAESISSMGREHVYGIEFGKITIRRRLRVVKWTFFITVKCIQISHRRCYFV